MLTALWLEGQSAAQIANRLGGVTRNAVIGKVHRLGLGGRVSASAPSGHARRPAYRARPARARRASRPPIAPQAPRAPEAPGLIVDLVDLGAHACRWPIGDPKHAGFTFCGRPADGPYCPAHAAASVQPGTAWRADRDPVVRRALAGLA
ncbi:MAG: GcrA family cell cycle regulator [Caulobacteraceae bacterium]|nr:GcrA family cell cycle regulator [Caulobacteraceae bacterium]